MFTDGSVLAFSRQMETFAAASSATASPVELCVTSLCLSRYRPKVQAALGLFNTFNPQPRLVEGLVPEGLPVRLWRGVSPIDALVLSTDPGLFSVRDATNPNNTTPNNVEARTSSSTPTFATLDCAMRKVSLTLHPARRMFSVKWPARVVSESGSSYLYVPPTDAHGNITSLSPTERVQPYVEMEQLFPILNAPAQWEAMLKIALSHDAAYTENPTTFYKLCAEGDLHKESASDMIPQQHHTTMLTLPQPLVFTTSPTHAQIRFPALVQEDAHALVASTEIHNLTCQSERLHTVVSALMGGTGGRQGSLSGRLLTSDHSAQSGSNRQQEPALPSVLWRLDGDPQERSPHCVYWCLGEQQWAYNHPPEGTYNAYRNNVDGSPMSMNQQYLRDVEVRGPKQPYEYRDEATHRQHEEERRAAAFDPALEGVVEAYVAEDLSTVTLFPNRRPSTMTETGTASTSFVVVHTRRLPTRTVDEYHYDPSDDSVRLPASLPATLPQNQTISAARVVGAGNVFAFLPTATAASTAFPSPTSTSAMLRTGHGEVHTSYPLMGGRYLQSVGYSASSISLCHLRRRNTNGYSVSGALGLARAPAGNGSSSGRLVVCESRLEGVGTFTALFNGTVRGSFDDRTILTLVPDELDSELGLVAHILLPDATTRQCRVVQCTPDNPAYHYLQYLLPFRRFSRMPESERLAAFGVGSGADGGGNLPAQPPLPTPQNQTSRTHPVGLNRSSFSSSVADYGGGAAEGGQLDIDVLLFHTRQILTASSGMRERNHALLRSSTSEDPYFASTAPPLTR